VIPLWVANESRSSTSGVEARFRPEADVSNISSTRAGKNENLRKKFGEIEKLITKNANVREFNAYLESNEHLLPMLENLDVFKEEIWKAYFRAKIDLYNQLIDRFQAAEKRKGEIEKAASDQRTQWERVIEIFNRRFFVPFKVVAKNRVSVILGQAPMLKITNKELDDVYRAMFAVNHDSVDPAAPVIEGILQQANACVTAPEGTNFENKIVLAIAIRLIAERYMVGRIADEKFVAAIAANQTGQLFRKFRTKFDGEEAALEVLQRVILMTPESIHLNSFMYEPILDMSDGHLRKLCKDVLDLSKPA
jgi:hypothetical protein